MDLVVIWLDCSQGFDGSILLKRTSQVSASERIDQHIISTMSLLYLVFLAGGGRRFDEFLQDPQAHQCNVFHHHRGLYIHRHQEQTQG